MRPSALYVLLAFVFLADSGSPRNAGAAGYLWLGAEYHGEGNVYRYNIGTGMVDKVSAFAGTDHWNNMATDGTYLYLGHPTSGTMNRHDAITGDFISPGGYSSTLDGHKEDGAFWDGSLWRITYSGNTVLHRMTTAGVAETTFTMPSNLGFVGIEFVDDTIYATRYNGHEIGTLQRVSATTLAFIPIPWAQDQEPSYQFAALAYDADAGDLYMATASSRLFRLTFVAGEAYAEEIVDLGTVGYPTGALPDGMGWVSGGTVDVPGPHGDGEVGLELAAPWPNPARESVWFELRLPRPAATHVGVYDVSGRALRTWNLPGLGAGASRFMWDFRAADGARVPAGLYFVRIRTEDGEVQGRIVRVD